MSDENKGISGLKSLRLEGMKLSELPLGRGEIAAEQISGFIQQERENQVNAIIARYPKAKRPFCEGAIKEAEHNIETFKQQRKDTLAHIDEYHALMRGNDGREWDEVESEVTQLVIDKGKPQPDTPEFKQLMDEITVLNATRKPYDEQSLWKQIKQYHGDLERFDEAIETERESIHHMKDTISLIEERDRLITDAMTKPMAVE